MTPQRQHQVFPHDLRDLVCGTCPARSPWMDSVRSTHERARVSGWHVFEGESLAGTVLKAAYCETCWKAGAPTPRRQVGPMEGQMEMFPDAPAAPGGKRKSKKQQYIA